jgi:hypothetical protein
MIPAKFPIGENGLTKEEIVSRLDAYKRGPFHCEQRDLYVGEVWAVAKYMVELKLRHPVMYCLFYRWWIPSLLPKNARKLLPYAIHATQQINFLPFWAEFAKYHPVLFAFVFFFQFVVQFLTTPIKTITVGLTGKEYSAPAMTVVAEGLYDFRVDYELTHQDSNVPAN